VAITEGVLKQVRYPPEKLVDAFAGTLPAANPPLYLAQFSGEWILRLQDIATPGSTGVTIDIHADKSLYPTDQGQALTSQAPAGLPDHWRITALDSLALSFDTSASVSDFIASWGLWVRRPSLADKLRWKSGYVPAGDEARLASLLPAGYVPQVALDRLIEAVYHDQAQVMVFEGTVGVGTASGLPASQQVAQIVNTHPPAGYFDVLVSVAVDATVGGTISLATAIANGIVVNVARDGSQPGPGVNPFLFWPAAGAPFNPSVGTTLDTSRVGGVYPFIVARQNLAVWLTTSAAVSGVPFHLMVWRCKEYNIHRALWAGTPGVPPAPQDVVDRVQAGVF